MRVLSGNGLGFVWKFRTFRPDVPREEEFMKGTTAGSVHIYGAEPGHVSFEEEFEILRGFAGEDGGPGEQAVAEGIEA